MSNHESSLREVTLVPVERRHLPQMLLWRNDPRVYKWCRQFEPISEAHHNEWFESLAKRSDVRMYAIETEYFEVDGAPDRAIVGVCGLTSIDYINRRAEFSLYIGPEFGKKGYGKAALGTLVSHAFNVLNLNVVWGESFADNPAAKMFESIGFKHEGTRRQFYYREGEDVDAGLYSISRHEYLLHKNRRHADNLTWEKVRANVASGNEHRDESDSDCIDTAEISERETSALNAKSKGGRYYPETA